METYRVAAATHCDHAATRRVKTQGRPCLAEKTHVRGVFLLWMACVVMGGAALMTRHHRTLRPGVVPEASVNVTGAAGLVHVLAPGCGCSQRIARDLVGQPGRILWAGAAAARELRDRYGVPGGPWLLAFGRDGRLVYSGGYGRQVDKKMLARLAAGHAEPARRSYGCAFGSIGDESIGEGT